MYLLITHIPIYVKGSQCFLQNDWFHDVLLARDWLAEPFGKLVLIAPFRQMNDSTAHFDRVDASTGIEAVPVFDECTSIPSFWMSHQFTWMKTIRRYLSQAKVVHSTMDQMYRPMVQMAYSEACKSNVTTVFVGPDMDIRESWKNQISSEAVIKQLRMKNYMWLFDNALQRHLPKADLALLKEGAVFNRFSKYATNPKAFCHTMYSKKDMVSEAALEQRIATLHSGRPLRLVYFGRLVPRKGVHVSIDIVTSSIAKGANVTFDIIGGGPEEQSLMEVVRASGLGEKIRFMGSFPYGAELFENLKSYDALLFTPLEEDTPRMLYDAYAFALPFLAAEIPFVQHRLLAEKAGITFPVNDVGAGCNTIIKLDSDRSILEGLIRKAYLSGLHHSIENWYQQRRDWTIEAFERKKK